MPDMMYSSDQIWVGDSPDVCLTDDLDDIKSDITALTSSKANVVHTHDGYAASVHTHNYNSIADTPTALPANGGNADTVDGKHSSDFAETSDIAALQTQINNKADSTHSHANYAGIVASNEFNGEQKLTNSQYCATLTDTANGIGCALKASRGLFNELLVDNVFMTPYTGQIPFYTYSAISDGSMSSSTKVGYIDSSGNASFIGNVSASNLADTVVYHGTSGDMRYQKWSSGKSEMWYYETLGEVALTTSMAGGVWSNTDCSGRVVNFPSGLFINKPIAVGNVYSDGYTFCQIAAADTTRMIYRVWSPYSITISGAEVSIHVIGRWK